MLSHAIFFALSGAAATAATPEAPYPVTEVFEAFREGCGAIESQTATAERLKNTEWRLVPVSEQKGALRDFVAYSTAASKAAAAEQQGVTMADILAFEREIAGETVFIILDEVSADGIRISGCQLYDFGETRPFSADEATKLVGRSPDDVVDLPEIKRSEWVPGILPEHDSFKVLFVPDDSPAVAMFNFSGLALMSDAIGED